MAMLSDGMAPSSGQGNIDLSTLNLINRASIINSSDRIIMPIFESVPLTAGKRERFLVSNVGFIFSHKIRAKMTVAVAADAGASAVPSALCPFNLFSHVGLVDYSQRYRTNCAGWELWMANSLIYRKPAYRNNESQASILYPLMNAPSTVAAGETKVFDVVLDANWAVHYLSDLRGILPANNGGGNAYVELQLPAELISAARDDTIPFFGDVAKTTISVEVSIFQGHYNVPAFDPANMWGTGIPVGDIYTAYEVIGHDVRSDNFAIGKKRTIDYTVDRNIAYIVHHYFVDGLLDNDNIQYVQLVRGANYPYEERKTMEMCAEEMRMLYGNDFFPGMILWDHSRKPVFSNKVGLFQTEIYPAAIGASRELHTLFIDFFSLNQTITGITQS